MLHYGLGGLLSMLLAAGISVWGFDYIESAWGHYGSFMVLSMVAAGCMVLATLVFGAACVVLGRFPKGWKVGAAGALSSLLGAAVLQALDWGREPLGVLLPLVVFPALAWVSAAVVSRHGA